MQVRPAALSIATGAESFYAREMREIVMQGPGKNALSTVTMTRLLDGLREAGSEPLLLRGDGDAFSAGLDLKEVATLEATTGRAFLSLLERCMCALYFHPAPTVACINGHAIAGGCVLALCCDVRVSTPNPKVKIGLNEVALGLRFPPRVLGIVRARVAPRFVEEVMLGAALYDPAGALRVGLIDALADDPLAVGREKLEALAAHPRHAYAQAKRDLRGAVDADLATDEVEARWLAESVGAWTSPELKQRIIAALGPKSRS